MAQPNCDHKIINIKWVNFHIIVTMHMQHITTSISPNKLYRLLMTWFRSIVICVNRILNLYKNKLWKKSDNPAYFFFFMRTNYTYYVYIMIWYAQQLSMKYKNVSFDKWYYKCYNEIFLKNDVMCFISSEIS